MATVRRLITRSLRLINAVATGETPTADEEQDALEALNNLLEGWSVQRLLIHTISRQVFPLTAGKHEYTIGIGGDFNVTRPIQIERALLQLVGTQDFELPISIIDHREYSEISTKLTQSTIPTTMWDDRNFPLRKLTLWPVPTEASHSLVLHLWQPLTQFTSVNEDVAFPTGYERALRYNLAVELAPEFGRPVTPVVAQIAVDSLDEIKRQNYITPEMDCDAGTLNQSPTFNYLTGY